MISLKFYDDEYIPNSLLAKIAGISTERLIEIEFQFFRMIDFLVNVNHELFEDYKKRIYEYSQKINFQTRNSNVRISS